MPLLIYRVFAVSLVLLLAAFASANAQSTKCRPSAMSNAQDVERIDPTGETQHHPNVRALVSVDLLGRFAVALDFDRDGFIDKAMLFTAAEPLRGPWSLRIESATVVSIQGTLRVLAEDYSFVAALAVAGRAVPEICWRDKGIQDFKQSLVDGTGQELLWVSGAGHLMESIRHDVLESWPPSFQQNRTAPDSTHQDPDK